jgi:hypothetical protein
MLASVQLLAGGAPVAIADVSARVIDAAVVSAGELSFLPHAATVSVAMASAASPSFVVLLNMSLFLSSQVSRKESLYDRAVIVVLSVSQAKSVRTNRNLAIVFARFQSRKVSGRGFLQGLEASCMVLSLRARFKSRRGSEPILPAAISGLAPSIVLCWTFSTTVVMRIHFLLIATLIPPAESSVTRRPLKTPDLQGSVATATATSN